MTKLLSHPAGRGLYGIFNDSFPPILDGVTLTVQNYARWLGEMGREPCIVTPWNPLRYDCGHDVMRYFSLPIWSRHPYRYGYPKLDPFIWPRLRATDFRLLHSHCPFSSGRLAVYVKRHHDIPLIGTFHSKYRDDLEHSFKLMRFCVPIIMKRILDFFEACDEVWIPQARVEETVREYGYKGPLTVVENGNDFTDFATAGNLQSYRKEARRRLGYDDSKLQLLFVGQHIFEKGTDKIIDALSLLDKNIDWEMHFIGQGYAAAALKEKSEKLGLADRIIFHGVMTGRRNLADRYAAADLFVFPSMYDNAPLVVREAAAMGTPSLLLRGSTASEVIADGRNGFLSEPDINEFASAITRLASQRDILRQTGIEARHTLVRSWEDVVAEVADRYDSLERRYKNKNRI